MIRVLIVEDSPAVQRVLISLLNEEDNIEIVGVASNGDEGLKLCRKTRPDLVTMDIYMPELDGLEATRRIMKEFPTRIVIISSMAQSKNVKTFEAIRSGAVDVIEKPHGVLSGDYSKVKYGLGQIIRQLMEARPENRFSYTPYKPWVDPETEAAEKIEPPAPAPKVEKANKGRTPSSPMPAIPRDFVPEIVCIGGSTGAPAILCDILSSLPLGFQVPIIVGQHIASGFIMGMVEWLNSSVALNVEIATHGKIVRPGSVTVAPDSAHIKVGSKGNIKIVSAEPGDLYTPSIDILYQSIAQSYGDRGLGIILSGMGRDGAQGLLSMREAGAITVAQNEASSVIYGMPKEAEEVGAVVKEMNPVEIIALLSRFPTLPNLS